MKRQLLSWVVLSVLFLFSGTVMAQEAKVPINRTILGLTLGETTVEQAKEILRRAGATRIEREEQTSSDQELYSAEGLSFSGTRTKAVMLQFVNNKLSGVSMSFPDEPSFNLLSKRLTDKYGEFSPTSTADDLSSCKVIVDERTGISVTTYWEKPRVINKFSLGTIFYVDLDLIAKVTSQLESEI